jgi:homospermidine synthase
MGDRKVLMVGFGAVAQCTLPILVKEAKIPCRQITVMDFEDRRAARRAGGAPRG